MMHEILTKNGHAKAIDLTVSLETWTEACSLRIWVCCLVVLLWRFVETCALTLDRFSLRGR